MQANSNVAAIRFSMLQDIASKASTVRQSGGRFVKANFPFLAIVDEDEQLLVPLNAVR